MNFGQFSNADKQNRCQVATLILFETRGLQLYWVVRGGIRLLEEPVPSQAHPPMVLIDTRPKRRAGVIPGRLFQRRTRCDVGHCAANWRNSSRLLKWLIPSSLSSSAAGCDVIVRIDGKAHHSYSSP